MMWGRHACHSAGGTGTHLNVCTMPRAEAQTLPRKGGGMRENSSDARIPVSKQAFAPTAVLVEPPPGIGGRSVLCTTSPCCPFCFDFQQATAAATMQHVIHQVLLLDTRVRRFRSRPGLRPSPLLLLDFPRPFPCLLNVVLGNNRAPCRPAGRPVLPHVAPSRASDLAGEPIPMVPRDPASDPDLANTLRLLLAWTFPRNVSTPVISVGVGYPTPV